MARPRDGMESQNEIFTKAEPQTVEIYKEVLQTIAKNKEIPEQWQKGQIIRLYKGKWKMGKCSNETRYNLCQQLWETVQKNIEQQDQKQNKLDWKPSWRPKGKSNNWPFFDPKRGHKRDMQPRKTSIRGILGCHKSKRQGIARCYNACDVQGRPQRPWMGPSEENEWICTTQH